MLRVQTKDGLSALQNVAQQQLQKVAFPLAGVAQNEDAGRSLVLGPAVQIHDDIGAVAVPANIKAFGVCLAGVVEGIQIGDRPGRQHTLELGGEHIAPSRVGGEEALPLPQKEPVRIQLAPDQFRRHFIPQCSQAVRVLGGQFDKDGAVDQRLTVFSHGCDEGGYILEVGFRGDGLLHPVGAAPVHPVLVLGVVEDLFLLRRGHLPGIDTQGHAALFSEIPKQSQFLCGSGVAAQRHGAAVEVPAHRIIRVEANRSGSDQVQKILGLEFRCPCLCRPFLFLLLFLSHGLSPTSLRHSHQSDLWSRPAGSTQPTGV